MIIAVLNWWGPEALKTGEGLLKMREESGVWDYSESMRYRDLLDEMERLTEVMGRAVRLLMVVKEREPLSRIDDD